VWSLVILAASVCEISFRKSGKWQWNPNSRGWGRYLRNNVCWGSHGNLALCLCADHSAVTQRPVDMMTRISITDRPRESATAAHDAESTRVVAVSLTVSAAALLCLIVIVRTTQLWFHLLITFGHEYTFNIPQCKCSLESVNAEFSDVLYRMVQKVLVCLPSVSQKLSLCCP